MSTILRPNGAPHHTRFARTRRTKEQNAALDAVYAQARTIRAAAFAEASQRGTSAQRYREIMEPANAQADRLIWGAK